LSTTSVGLPNLDFMNVSTSSLRFANLVTEVSSPILEGQLINAYPNPFSDQVNIEFTLNESAQVNISVYNETGNRIALVTNQIYNAGKQSVVFNRGSLSKGVYFYSVTINGNSITNKMVIK
jgi:hypothetical protein